jgi:nitrogen-specific signal transduction histidine kinase
MTDAERSRFDWIDLLWLVFLAGLALLPPVNEIHKQLVLLAIGVYQVLEGRLIARFPTRGPVYSILVKTALATLLLEHTGDAGINSAYYPIYYLPVVTAAINFGAIGTILWTLGISLAYCSLLILALQEYEVLPSGYLELAIRILFFFLAGMLVNRFVVESKKQTQRYQLLSEQLAQTNRELQRVQADARRAERLAALGQMSAGLAHEIRNPLGVIKGSAEMLEKKLQGANPLESELAGYISSEVNRLNGLVTRFLDFARPSQLELSPLRIENVLERALEAAHARYPAAAVSVERAYAKNLPAILADEQLCEQVFANLIFNAYEGMEGFPGKLRVATSAESRDGRTGLRVEIEDSGPGVPAELREQIFNPFVTSKKTGVGLGLSIVAKIVDDHRGAIQLISETGQGAFFRVFLPATPAQEIAPRHFGPEDAATDRR